MNLLGATDGHVKDRERGFSLLEILLMILSIVGSTAAVLTTSDLKIGENYRSCERAVYAAEAGIEARARLRVGATGAINAGKVGGGAI